jgi:hypothetical protein
MRPRGYGCYRSRGALATLPTRDSDNGEPTDQELEMLNETAKKKKCNGSTAIDWSRPVGTEGTVLDVQVAFSGTNFFSRLTPDS